MPLQQCLTLSSDPNSLAQLTAVCVFAEHDHKEEFSDSIPLTFPNSFRTMQKSSLGAFKLLEHHFQASNGCCVAPHCPQTTHSMMPPALPVCISYCSRVPTGKILLACQENISRLRFL